MLPTVKKVLVKGSFINSFISLGNVELIDKHSGIPNHYFNIES